MVAFQHRQLHKQQDDLTNLLTKQYYFATVTNSLADGAIVCQFYFMSTTQPGRKPDYNVATLHKVDGRKGNVGVAWKQQDGSISITLNTFCQLPQQDGQLLITLFPAGNYAARPSLAKGTNMPDEDSTPF